MEVKCPQCKTPNPGPKGGAGKIVCGKCNYVFGITPAGKVVGATPPLAIPDIPPVPVLKEAPKIEPSKPVEQPKPPVSVKKSSNSAKPGPIAVPSKPPPERKTPSPPGKPLFTQSKPAEPKKEEAKSAKSRQDETSLTASDAVEDVVDFDEIEALVSTAPFEETPASQVQPTKPVTPKAERKPQDVVVATEGAEADEPRPDDTSPAESKAAEDVVDFEEIEALASTAPSEETPAAQVQSTAPPTPDVEMALLEQEVAKEDDIASTASDDDQLENRRRYLRIPSVIPVHLQIVSNTHGALDPEIRTGVTQDLSENGLCLRIRSLPTSITERLKTGDLDGLSIVVDLEVPDRPLRVAGRIVWNQVAQDEARSFDIGVEFVDLADEDGAAILRFAKRAARRPKIMWATIAALAALVICSGLVFFWRELTYRQAADVASQELSEATKRYREVATELETQTRALQDLSNKVKTFADKAADIEDLEDDNDTDGAPSTGQQSSSPLDEIEAGVSELSQTIAAVTKKAESLAQELEKKAQKKKKPKRRRKKRKRR